MPGTTRSAPWLASAAAAVALTGCSTTPPAADTASPAASYVRTSPWGEGDAALLEGVLALEDGCLTVLDGAGQAVVPVFPTDFTWDEDAGELTGFGHTFTVGEPLSLGGGFHDAWPASAEHRPAGCEGSQFFIVYSA